MKFHLLFALLFALTAISQPIRATASGSEMKADGATLRLIATKPDADGLLRGALVVDLAPGWKTYWLAPGQAGLAPRLDFAASEGLGALPLLSFPVPHRFDEGVSLSNVYAQPMAIAFTAPVTNAHPRLTLDLLVGLCETICVPLQARLERDLSMQPTLGEIAAVNAAFAALPDEAAQALDVRIADGTLSLSIALPPSAQQADLFVSAPSGWEFGPASMQRDADGMAVLSAPVIAAPRQADSPMTGDLLITAGEYARFWRGNPIRVETPGTDAARAPR